MKVEEFLKSFLRRNDKGDYHEIRILPPRGRFAYASGGERSENNISHISCGECGNPRSIRRGESAVAFTCSSCRERARLARLHIG